MNDKKQRIIISIIYLLILVAMQIAFIDSILPITNSSFWLLNGIAGLILGRSLLNPHFTPPADAAINSFVTFISFISILDAPFMFPHQKLVCQLFLAFSAICFIVSIGVILNRREDAFEDRKLITISEKLVKKIGSPDIIFTIAVICAVWIFHIHKPFEIFIILTSWFVVVSFDPINWIWNLLKDLKNEITEDPPELVGTIAAHQVPGLTLIRQKNETRHPMGALMLLGDDQGPTRLGVALNYVGRDDGILLRTLSLPLPSALTDDAEKKELKSGVAIHMESTSKVKVETSLKRVDSIRGIVDIETNLQTLRFEVVNEEDISDGQLVDVKIGDQSVIYQIIDGATKEDAVQEKNKFGYVGAKARKIGIWDDKKDQFAPVPWLPKMNSPVYVCDPKKKEDNPEAVGYFPNTGYFAKIDISSAVTHNTAILGILGIGKSYLAMELCDRLVKENIKFICFDLTDQYKTDLPHLYDNKFHEEFNNVLSAASKGRPTKKSQEQGGSIIAFNKAVYKQVLSFLKSDKDALIFNPSQFRVSKQTSFVDNNGEASFEDLTPSQITALFSAASLKVCQEMGMADKARLCLVYEEAHTLVPEFNSVASKGDQLATAATARAILQGRKFGLGCFLITQRTANVTKTILNQCNSIFAMRTFDDSGKNFLSNFIGSDYANMLPSIKARQAVFFGKASSCEDPVLLRLNDREDFVKSHNK